MIQSLAWRHDHYAFYLPSGALCLDGSGIWVGYDHEGIVRAWFRAANDV